MWVATSSKYAVVLAEICIFVDMYMVYYEPVYYKSYIGWPR